jgi:predicted nucleic acid-binding protein
MDAVIAATALVLVDTSVWTRVARRAEVAAAITARISGGSALCTCALVDLELLHSARGPVEYDEWASTRAQAYSSLPLTPAAGARALLVQRELAQRGLHRAAKLPGLLIAAIAEMAGASVLHYDSDFDQISAVTGQPTEWIVPRGTID